MSTYGDFTSRKNEDVGDEMLRLRKPLTLEDNEARKEGNGE
jgi:hypothetical protein